MSNTILMGWNRAVAGREAHAMELFQSSMAFWGKKKEQGVIDTFEPVMLAAHGGDMNGFMLITGDPQKLDALQHDADYINLVMEISLVLEGFGAIRGFSGDRIGELMQSWGGLVQKYA